MDSPALTSGSVVLTLAVFLYGVIAIGLLTFALECYAEMEADGELQFEESDGTMSNRWGFKQVVFVAGIFACVFWLPLLILWAVFAVTIALFFPARRRRS